MCGGWLLFVRAPVLVYFAAPHVHARECQTVSIVSGPAVRHPVAKACMS